MVLQNGILSSQIVGGAVVKKHLVPLLLVFVVFTSACGGRTEKPESNSSQQVEAETPDEEEIIEFPTVIRSEDFKISDVITECQAGEVTFTASYTASEDGYWYLWRFHENGGCIVREGTFSKGNASFSFTVSAEEELNATFGDLGETREWYIYLSSVNMTNGSDTDGSLFDSWRIGDRSFFENIAAGQAG